MPTQIKSFRNDLQLHRLKNEYGEAFTIELRRYQEPNSNHWSATVNAKDFFGCFHDLILAKRPDFRPFVNMHLAGLVDGAPMHAYSNGLYWFTGIVPRGAELYRFVPTQSAGECARILNEHYRCDVTDIIKHVWGTAGMYRAGENGAATRKAIEDAVEVFTDAQRDRWAHEAAELDKLFQSLKAD